MQHKKQHGNAIIHCQFFAIVAALTVLVVVTIIVVVAVACGSSHTWLDADKKKRTEQGT